MPKFHLNSISILSLLALVALSFSFNTSFAQCSSCTKTYNGSGSTNFNLSGSDVLCVKSNMSGSINVNGNGATICVNSGVSLVISSGNFNGNFTLESYGSTKFNNSVNLAGGTTINIHENGTLISSSFNFNGSGSSINVDGTWTNSNQLTLPSGNSIANTGTINFNNKNVTIQGNLSNSSNGELTNINKFNIDGSNATLSNSGIISVNASGAEAFVVRNGGELINNQGGTLSVPNGQLKVTSSGSEISNSGSINADDFTNDEASFINQSTGSVFIADYFENRGPSTNDGSIEVDGDFYQSNKGPSGQFINNGFVTIAQNFTVANGGYISGSGGFSVGGTSTNDGIVSDVDICDQSTNNGGNFDGGSGSSNNTTSCQFALPVDLTYFEKRESEAGFYFEWETAMELNASHFKLEMRNENNTSETIEVIKCRGSEINKTTYQSVNISKKFTGIRYYRLVQYDFDGKHENFAWVAVNGNDKLEGKVSVFPNPASNLINVELGHSNGAIVVLYDENGRQISMFVHPAGSSLVQVNIEKYNVANFVYLELISGSDVQRAQVMVLDK